jgi:LPXTG-motif cell wall-anchored protein
VDVGVVRDYCASSRPLENVSVAVETESVEGTRKMRSIQRFGAVLAAGALIGAFGSSAVQAQTDSGFSISSGPQDVFAPINTTVELTTQPTPEGFSGRTCTVTAQDDNNESVHLNDLVVQSGSETVTVSDIEDQAGVGSLKTATPSEMTLGDTVTLSVLILNEDDAARELGIMSANIIVFFECAPTETSTTSTTIPTSTGGDTTATTSPSSVSPTAGTLPSTGMGDDGTTMSLLVAIMLLSAGGAMVLAVRRRPT